MRTIQNLSLTISRGESLAVFYALLHNNDNEGKVMTTEYLGYIYFWKKDWTDCSCLLDPIFASVFKPICQYRFFLYFSIQDLGYSQQHQQRLYDLAGSI